MSKKKNNQPVTLKELEKLLKQQTKEIEERLDKKIEERLSQQAIVVLSAVDEKLKKMELRISKKIEKLTTTLDGFLKRLIAMEEEFEMMKLDINRMKKVIKEKLGVDLF